ncbi:MAG: hypothetical protein LBK06_10230 [Planctomycetaceae bacterium]|nr:hypothetical protein [Planctomycetaceae bacterium]
MEEVFQKLPHSFFITEVKKCAYIANNTEAVLKFKKLIHNRNNVKRLLKGEAYRSYQNRYRLFFLDIFCE